MLSTAKRQAWMKLLQGELAHCARLGIDLRCRQCVEAGADLHDHTKALRTMHAHKGTWRWSDDPNYAYRAILPNEIVFDVGDDVKETVHGTVVRRPLEWHEIVAESESLWDELDDARVEAYYAALSANKGTHTHVFLEDPTDGFLWDGSPGDFATHDLRTKVADWVTVRQRLRGTVRTRYDPACIAPSHGGRQLREFGAVKTNTKTLLFVGPSGRKPLPSTRADAYFSAGIKYPQTLVRCRSVDGLHQARLRAALRQICPRSFGCVEDRASCSDCPF